MTDSAGRNRSRKIKNAARSGTGNWLLFSLAPDYLCILCDSTYELCRFRVELSSQMRPEPLARRASENKASPALVRFEVANLRLQEPVSDGRLWKTTGLTYPLDYKGFPPWLVQVGANLETRKTHHANVRILAFHLGSPRWERIWRGVDERWFASVSSFFARWMEAASGDQETSRKLRLAPRQDGLIGSQDWRDPVWMSCDQIRSHLDKPKWKAKTKTLVFMQFLVSKFASTWASQCGKLVTQRLDVSGRFPNPSPLTPLR